MTTRDSKHDTDSSLADGDGDAAASARARLRGEPPATPRTDDGGKDGALKALAFALDKKGLEPILLDVRELCSYCSYQLIVSGRSERNVYAICDGIVAGLRDLGIKAIGSEGKSGGQWALLDFGDFLVHVFHHPIREHYDLEGLWIDAPRVAIDVPADARIPADQY